MKPWLPLVLLLISGAACAGPGGRGARAGAGATAEPEDQAILDQVPTTSEAAAQAERDVNERNADQILEEIRREVGGR
jgi:hypothetical protein